MKFTRKVLSLEATSMTKGRPGHAHLEGNKWARYDDCPPTQLPPC